MNVVLEELQRFRKHKRNVYVDFVNGLVKWGKKTYNLTYKNVGGQMYPYVIITKVKPLSEIKPLIRTVCQSKNKYELKYVEYDYNGHSYFVIGIGPDAIKVIKDDSKRPKFLHYNETEGQGLLNVLVGSLNGQVILTGD